MESEVFMEGFPTYMVKRKYVVVYGGVSNLHGKV